MNYYDEIKNKIIDNLSASADKQKTTGQKYMAAQVKKQREKERQTRYQKELAKSFEDKKVVSNFTYKVKDDDRIGIVGANGSGKSTILKTLTKQVEMFGGAVFLAGNDIANMKESELAKHMSMVMTEKITAELMTCRDIVATGRYPYTGMLGVLSDNDYEIVDNAISLLGADEVANEDFNSISDGQRQRIMLARAICQEPELLILDEPTSFLDIRYKIDILNSIRKLAREKNIAVIMSLHELDLAYKISDIIAIVNNKNNKDDYKNRRICYRSVVPF